MKEIDLKHLDEEINTLKIHDKYDELTENGKDKLQSFIEIKEQLRLCGVGVTLPSKMDYRDARDTFIVTLCTKHSDRNAFGKGFDTCVRYTELYTKDQGN